MKEYKVIAVATWNGRDFHDFVDEVNDHLKNGWELGGNMIVNNELQPVPDELASDDEKEEYKNSMKNGIMNVVCYYQPMIKE